MTTAHEFVTKWARSIEVSVSPQILRAQWDSKRNQEAIKGIVFPEGVLEELTRLVDARVGQLRPVLSRALSAQKSLNNLER